MPDPVDDAAMPPAQLISRAHELIAANQYLTLATADPDGTPWSSTVWYAVWPRSATTSGLAVEFLWLSRPQAQHSRNIEQRPAVGISIFDSAQPAGTGDGLQFAALVGAVPAARLDEAVVTFSDASAAAGGGPWTRADVEDPAGPRLYVARLSRALLLEKGTPLAVPLA